MIKEGKDPSVGFAEEDSYKYTFNHYLEWAYLVKWDIIEMSFEYKFVLVIQKKTNYFGWLHTNKCKFVVIFFNIIKIFLYIYE